LGIGRIAGVPPSPRSIEIIALAENLEKIYIIEIKMVNLFFVADE